MLCMHPQVIGRGHRLVLLDGLGEHFASHEGVRFEPLGEYATRWSTEKPVDAWLATHPVHAGAGHRPAYRPAPRTTLQDGQRRELGHAQVPLS